MEPTQLIGNKYRILNKINEGSFGAVYKSINVRTRVIIILKLEPIRNETKLLKNETKVYQYLNSFNEVGIPRVYWFGTSGNDYCMAMEYLGPSLKSSNTLTSTSASFDFDNLRSLAHQMLNRLQFIHSKEIIHRDIKPDNFLLKNEILYIIDFGLCRKYKDTDGLHIVERKEKRESIIGTPNYVSIHVLEGGEPSRRDDLESLVYIMYYLWKGDINIDDKYKFIHMDKYNNSIPLFMTRFFNACRNLQFNETPDYKILYSILYEGTV